MTRDARAKQAWRHAASRARSFVHRRRGVHGDPLTSLGNRALLFAHAGEISSGGALRALLLLDLDGFKQVNDTLGHHNGDLVLQEVATRINRAVGDDDVAVRLGGDEFAVLTAPLDDAEQASALAAAIIDRLSRPVRLEGVDLTISCSLGIGLTGLDGDDLDSLLRAADRAMYSAKTAGRAGGVLRVGGSAWLQDTPDTGLVEDLVGGLEREELRLHYQPQVDVEGAVVGCEALLRWQHPTRGLLAPHAFLPAAERSGLLDRITLVAVRIALRDQPALSAAAGHPVSVSVNVSPRDLLGREFLPELARLLAATPPAAAHLVLEITEPAPFPVPAVIELFRRLTRLGLAVSIHEFGAGRSSLTALSQYPGVSEVKIHPTLVRQVSDDTVARLVRAIVAAAHGLGVHVVAEGIEDEESARCLTAMGCDRLQGFWIAPPASLDDTTAWIDDRGRPPGPMREV